MCFNPFLSIFPFKLKKEQSVQSNPPTKTCQTCPKSPPRLPPLVSLICSVSFAFKRVPMEQQEDKCHGHSKKTKLSMSSPPPFLNKIADVLFLKRKERKSDFG